ncbi:MAG: hypothetical protein AVDCRST_MAG74-1104, partial [uncultured Pyrinomonadaceae bacterium]
WAEETKERAKEKSSPAVSAKLVRKAKRKTPPILRQRLKTSRKTKN